MKEVDYNIVLTEEDKVRIKFRKKHGRIEHFIVQYFALINSRWRSIMRIDTCHGYAHKHTYHLNKKEHLVALSESGNVLNNVFTESSSYIKTNFRKIKQNFLNN